MRVSHSCRYKQLNTLRHVNKPTGKFAFWLSIHLLLSTLWVLSKLLSFIQVNLLPFPTHLSKVGLWTHGYFYPKFKDDFHSFSKFICQYRQTNFTFLSVSYYHSCQIPSIFSSASQEMRESLRVMQESSVCKNCKQNVIDVVCIPCGHLSLCNNCAPNIKKCPVCKTKIQETMKIFRA